MRILRNEVKFENRYIKVNVSDFEKKDGSIGSWTWVQRQKTSKTILIVPVSKFNDKVVLIKEFRIPIGQWEYGFPAGLLNDENENAIEAAIRELKEETGLNVTNVLYKYPTLYKSAGLTDESVIVVIVQYDGTITDQFQESTENIRAKEYTVRELDDLMLQAEEGKISFGFGSFLILENLMTGYLNV